MGRRRCRRRCRCRCRCRRWCGCRRRCGHAAQGIGLDVALNSSLAVTKAHKGQKVTTGDAKPITNVVASPFAPKNKSVNGEKDVFVSFREFV